MARARAAVAHPILARRGLGNLQARKKAIMDSTQVMVQACGVRDTTDILWLTRSRFIAHHIYVEGIEGATLEQKEAAAAAKCRLGRRVCAKRGANVC